MLTTSPAESHPMSGPSRSATHARGLLVRMLPAAVAMLSLVPAGGCQLPVVESVVTLRSSGNSGTAEPPAVSTSLTPSTPTSVATDAMFDRAIQLQTDGRLTDSRDTLIVLLKQTPDHFGAVELLGKVSHDLNDRLLYRASLQRLIQLRPDSGVVLHRAGVELLKLARISAVHASADTTSISQTTALGPTDPTDVEAGLQALRDAVTREPGNRQFIQSLFSALVDLERRSEAEAVLREALRRNPRDAVLPLTAARFYEASNNWDTALSYYDTALRNDPANRVWKRQRAVCHFRMGNLAAAADDFSQALPGTPVGPQLAEHLMWSEACLQTEEYADAQRVLDRIVITGNLRTAELEMQRGLCRLQLEAYSEAGQIIAGALARWPRHAGLRRMAGRIEQAASRATADAS